MSPITNLYLKAIIRFGGSIALCMLLSDLITGDVRSLVKYFFMFVFMGGFLSAIFVNSHIDKVKTLLGKADLTDEDLSTNQSKTIISNHDPVTVLQKINAANDLNIKSIQADQFQISFEISKSWYTWSQIVRITWHKKMQDQYQYVLTSRPQYDVMIVDNGSNLENIQRMEKIIA